MNIMITVDEKGILKINSSENKSRSIDCRMIIDKYMKKTDICLYILAVKSILNGIENKVPKGLADKVRDNYENIIFQKAFEYIEKLENSSNEQSRCN